MKKAVFLSVLAVFFAVYLTSCASNQANTPEQDSPEANDNLGIMRGEGLVAPTANQEAMRLYKEGTDLMFEGNYEEAEVFLRKAVEEDPEFVDAIDHLALSIYMLGYDEEAIELAQKSIALNPVNFVPYNLLCAAFEAVGDYQAAFDACSEAIKYCPDTPEGYYNASIILMDCEMYEEAIWYIYEAMKIYMEMDSPILMNAVFNLTKCYFYIGDWDNCIRCSEIYLNYDPTNENMQKFKDAAEEEKERCR